MIIIKEEYVGKETAKLLKEAGFPQDGLYACNTKSYRDHSGEILIPTQSQAMRWLRDKCNIFIEMTFNDARTYPYYADIQSNMTGEFLEADYQRAHLNYETAAEAGIQAACRYLIEKEAD